MDDAIGETMKTMPEDEMIVEPGIDPLLKLSRDLKQAAKTLTATEARYLVDAYYQLQRDRIRASHQVLQSEKQGEPHLVIAWLQTNTSTLERNIKSALDTYTSAQPVGQWAKSIVGIGPVIAAGLLAHIDITRAPTVGHIWRFAGLDPTQTWEKSTKRPWNAELKRLCWLIGESFTKVSGNEKDFYGKLYLERKAQEITKNEALAFKDQAEKSLTTKKWRPDTATKAHYEKGMLPPARIHLRAQRYAVKLFLSHFHHVSYWHHYHEAPPKPYVLDHLGHVHLIQVPNAPEGMK
jgi:hypothetical protein